MPTPKTVFTDSKIVTGRTLNGKVATRIMGIDPGSRATGYGIIDTDGQRHTLVSSGTVRAAEGTFAERLKTIFDGIQGLVETFGPQEVAIEEVFVHKSVSSALKLGQARGAALAAAMSKSLSVHEYTPTKVKRAVTGHGHADKTQVQHMVRMLIGLTFVPAADEADALAVALCHAHACVTSAMTTTNPLAAMMARPARTKRWRR